MRFLSITMFALAGAACSSTTPFEGGALDVTVMASQALAANVSALAVQVSGAEVFDVTTPASSAFRQSGRVDVTVRASGTSGAVTVTVSGRNLAGEVIARGQADAVLQKGTSKATVTLADVAPAVDMAVPMDLATADLSPYPPIVPSSVSPTRYLANAPALSGLLDIDTTNLTFTRAAGTTNDGGFVESVDAGSIMPAGVEFVVDGNYAVLSTGAFTVDRELVVRGSRALVIVASGPVVIRNLIRAEGRGAIPGPGGSTGASGMGAGGNGVIVSTPGTGGGGGGFGGPGAPGAGFCATGAAFVCTVPAPAPGTAASPPTGGGGVGGAIFAPTALVGGSGGGHGGGLANCGTGGGGGGAIQISTSQTITILSPGAINVGGGGGLAPPYPACSGGGGGGGSGGMILLEARGITITGGQLSATGGGGGIYQNPGGNGTLLVGGKGVAYPPIPQISAGSGGTPTTPPTQGTDTLTSYSPGGSGGGGGFGAIRFRLPTGTTPSVTPNGVVVPAPAIDNF